MAALRLVAIIIALLAVIGLLIYVAIGVDDRGARSADTITATIGGTRFQLEIAADAESIERGMMFRESIPERGGMIFVFRNPQRRTFWMKNCLVDIDLLFLDQARRVVQIERMKAQPPQQPDEGDLEYEQRIREDASYESRTTVSYAVELKAGTVDRLGVGVGDRLDFDHARLLRLVR